MAASHALGTTAGHGVTSPSDNAPPLAGRRVAVTRPAERASGLIAQLEALGAEVVVAPAIAIVPPASYAALDRALEALLAEPAGYDWLALTSVAAVDAVATRLAERAGGQATLGAGVRVAAVGEATARAARRRLGRVHLVPPVPAADGLADAMPSARGARVLFPAADRARDALPAVLRARGARVDQVTAYQTVDAPAEQLAELAAHARAGRLDAVLVASPSAAGAVARACAGCDREGGRDGALAGVRAVCIGPTTADACRVLALPVAAVAAQPTDAALVDALLTLLSSPVAPPP